MPPAAPPTATALAPDVVRMRAHNPSPMTGTGSNCYLVRGPSGGVLIDAGPDLMPHVAAILQALGAANLAAILITHPHLDHSGAAPRISAHTGAKIYSFGPAALHSSSAMGGEGVDATHLPDCIVRDGARLDLAGLTITALHTPGHMQGHICYGLRNILFSGDHVMGWSTSLIAPPEGDMAAYRANLRRLQGLDYAHYLPGHGEAIDDPQARLAYLLDHRTMREGQILAKLAQGPADAHTLAATIYTDIPIALRPAAARNVLAHLIELQAQGRVFAKNHNRLSNLDVIFYKTNDQNQPKAFD